MTATTAGPDTATEADTVTRVPPGMAHDIDAHQGWALTAHPPGPARARAVDLVFLHGMAAGGWVWPEAWIAAFTGAGYRCWTLSLPGRSGGAVRAGGPEAVDRALAHVAATGDAAGALDMLAAALPGAPALDGPRLDDYADTLAAALDQIGRPAVAVCHSLGGAVAQCLMKRGAAPAGTVLMASVPPYGTWRAAAEMAVLNPQLWQTLARFSLFGPSAADPAVMRENFFPNGIGAAEFDRVAEGLRDESLAASLQAMGLPPFAPWPGPRRDVMVMGGGRDRIVPVTDVMLTAAYYGVVPDILPEAGHMIMREDIAGAAVARILAWLADREERTPQAA